MDIAGIVFAALGFVNQTINTGTFLSKLAHDVPDIEISIVSATTRLEAQQYTLQLWHQKWAHRAITRRLISPDEVNQELQYKII